MRRVVVTGIGAVTPLGVGAENTWQRLIAGESGIRGIQSFDVSDLPAKIAGQVPRGDTASGNFNADEWVPPKEQRKMDEFIVYALAAAAQAVDDSGWKPERDEDRERTGVMIGSGIGGLPGITEGAITLHERGPRRLSPFFIPSNLINLASGHVSIRYGFTGPNHAVVTACSTGAHAIGDATRLIQQYASFGLKGKTPLLGAMNATDQSVIRTLGEECDGIIAAAHFAEGSDNPVTAKFTRDYEAKYGKIPSLYGFSMYSSIMWVAEALKKIDGKAEDRDAFIDAVLKTELTGSPLGPTVKLDAYGNPIYDVQIRKTVKRADGKYWNVPIASYPGVSQFWKYDPETYMKQPPYSRTFQGIKKA